MNTAEEPHSRQKRASSVCSFSVVVTNIVELGYDIKNYF